MSNTRRFPWTPEGFEILTTETGAHVYVDVPPRDGDAVSPYYCVHCLDHRGTRSILQVTDDGFHHYCPSCKNKIYSRRDIYAERAFENWTPYFLRCFLLARPVIRSIKALILLQLRWDAHVYEAESAISVWVAERLFRLLQLHPVDARYFYRSGWRCRAVGRSALMHARRLRAGMTLLRNSKLSFTIEQK